MNEYGKSEVVATAQVVSACPFCPILSRRSDPRVHKSVTEGEFPNWYFVQCDGCSARGPMVRTQDTDGIAHAVRRWNERRVEPTKLPKGTRKRLLRVRRARARLVRQLKRLEVTLGLGGGIPFDEDSFDEGGWDSI
jgi:hypothetical protein